MDWNCEPPAGGPMFDPRLLVACQGDSKNGISKAVSRYLFPSVWDSWIPMCYLAGWVNRMISVVRRLGAAAALECVCSTCCNDGDTMSLAIFPYGSLWGSIMWSIDRCKDCLLYTSPSPRD